MSDTPQGEGWWQASDGKWYEPDLSRLPPPPDLGGVASATQPEPGWWRAKDGLWYAEGQDAPGQQYPFGKGAKRNNLKVVGVIAVVGVLAIGAFVWFGNSTQRDLDNRWNDMTSDQRDAICTVYNLGGIEGVTNVIMNADGNSDLDREDVREWVQGKVAGCT